MAWCAPIPSGMNSLPRRLFIGLDAARPELFKAGQETRRLIPGAYHPLENYHITLAFIGMWAGDVETVLCEAVAQAAKDIQPLRASLTGRLGAFKDPRQAVVYFEIEKTQELKNAAARVKNALILAGFNFQGEGLYTPHITLCRKANLLKAPIKDISVPQISFTAQDAVVYESLRFQGALTYRPLAYINLGSGKITLAMG